MTPRSLDDLFAKHKAQITGHKKPETFAYYWAKANRTTLTAKANPESGSVLVSLKSGQLSHLYHLKLMRF